MILWRQVHYVARIVLIKKFSQRRTIAYIDMAETISKLAVCLWNRIEIGGVRKLIDADDECLCIVE